MLATLYTCTIKHIARSAQHALRPHLASVSYLRAQSTCEAIHINFQCTDNNNNDIKSSANRDIFNANQSTEQQHPQRLMDAPLNRKRLQDTKQNGKFHMNDVAMTAGNRKKRQHQIRRRHQPIDSTLNARVQLHETIMPKREAYRQSEQTKLHTIPEENVIIRICSKVFRKCFSSSSPPYTVQVVSVRFIN